MNNRMHNFKTHRCDLMPKGFSIRKYFNNEKYYQWPKAGGWVLGRRGWDSEWDYNYLDHFNPGEHEGIQFCPWCGEKL